MLAFPQALVKTNIYLHAPRGIKINFQGKDKVLKLDIPKHHNK